MGGVTNHIEDALERAGREQYQDRPIPPTVYGQITHLLDQAAIADRRAIRGTDQPPAGPAELARRVADLLGVAPRTVERWRDKQVTRARAAGARALADAVRRTWKPRLRARARRDAAATGFTIEARARFGYKASRGTTDQARMRIVTARLTPEHARRLLDAQDRGADDQELRQILALALQEIYFQDGGRRARGLEVSFTDIAYIDASFRK